MATLEQIYNVEAALESAFKAVAESVISGLTGYTSEQNASKAVTPWIEFMAQLGGAREQKQKDNDGNWHHSVWDATVTAAVTTKRQGAQGPGVMRAKLRNAFQDFRLNFGTDVLPYHAISMIRDDGTNREVDDDKDLEISRMQWRVIVSVRQSAWPDAAP